MDTLLRRKLLAFLAGTAIAMASGSAENVKSELAMIPEPILVELLGQVDEEVWSSPDIRSLLDLLAEDPRRLVRRRAAEFLRGVNHKAQWDDLEPVLKKLAQDPDQEVRNAVAGTLADWLAQANGLTRAHVVFEWAISDATSIRHTLARALSYGVQSLATDLIVEYLAEDPDPTVRSAIVEAVERRFEENPALFSAILHRLALDDLRQVRRSARRALKRVNRTA